MAFSWFDPSTWPANTLSQSILPGWSLFTVNETNSTDPATEQRVLAGNSYGRQIGRMMDVLEALVKANPAVAETKAGTKFEELRKEVQKAKDNAKADRLKKLMDDLRALKEDDPVAFRNLLDEI